MEERMQVNFQVTLVLSWKDLSALISMADIDDAIGNAFQAYG
jgi:hypothetical protein